MCKEWEQHAGYSATYESWHSGRSAHLHWRQVHARRSSVLLRVHLASFRHHSGPPAASERNREMPRESADTPGKAHTAREDVDLDIDSCVFAGDPGCNGLAQDCT